MSGGSYNYLCFKNSLNLIEDENDDLDSMIDRLRTIPEAEKVLTDSLQVLNTLESIRNQFKALELFLGPLQNVWKAVEWYDSSDISFEDVLKSLKEYENPHNPIINK